MKTQSEIQIKLQRLYQELMASRNKIEAANKIQALEWVLDKSSTSMNYVQPVY